MKSINNISFDGEPSRTTHRFGLTKQNSANAGNSFNINLKNFNAAALFDILEEEEKMVKFQENAAGVVTAA